MKLFCFIFVALFFSCIPQTRSKKVLSIRNCSIPLYIEMPKNKVVFENISSMVYDALWSHFLRVGFLLVGKKNNCYSLKVTVKKVENDYKFLSPDLLSYATKVRIELFCQLLDYKDKTVAEKTFTFGTLVSKAKRHVENATFSDFEYRRLIERDAYKIDQYFRPLLVKKPRTTTPGVNIV
jgi:hypothetical protein